MSREAANRQAGAIEDLAATLREMFYDALCPALTCTEAERLGRAMAALGHPDVAVAIVGSHGAHESETEDDAHYDWSENQAEALVARWVAGDWNATADEYDHDPRPDDDPQPGDRCKDCGEPITWMGPSQYDWMHVGDKRNRVQS